MRYGLTIGSVLLLGILAGCLTLGDSDDLVFSCSFDSEAAIREPEIGPKAILADNVRLVPGVKGMALAVPPKVACLSYPLGKAFFGRKGCIEFWGKIEKPQDRGISDGGDPRFFCIKWENQSEALIDYNSNNGCGRSGFHALLPGFNLTSHDRMGFHRYQDILGDSWREWKHYALVWNEDGIAGLEGTPRIAVLVNGRPYRMFGADSHVDHKTMQELTATLDIPRNPHNGTPFNNKSPFLIDEFKIWKTDRIPADK